MPDEAPVMTATRLMDESVLMVVLLRISDGLLRQGGSVRCC